MPRSTATRSPRRSPPPPAPAWRSRRTASRPGLGLLLPFTVVRSGGVHRAGCRALDDAFHAEIRLRLPTCPVHLLEEPPAAGAALLALDRLGHVDSTVRERLLREAVR